MIRWLVLGGVLCSGCDVFFSLHHFDHDAAVIVDAADAGTQIPCSKMSMLADGFEDGSIGRMWPTHNSFGDVGGYGHADLTQSGAANLTSDRYYDLRDDHVQLSITTTNFNDVGGDTLQLIASSTRPGYGLTITRTGPNLRFDRIENGSILSLGSVTYNQVMHRYWRIANAGGLTTFETAPDPDHFTVQASMAGLDYVAFMKIDFGAQTSSNPGYLLDLDDVNGGTPIGTACPMTVLADRFAGTTIDERWARTNLAGGGGTISEHDGILEMAFVQSVTTNASLIAASIYDLTVAPFSAEIPQMVDFSAASTQLFQMVATDPDNETVLFRESAGVLYALYNSPTLGAGIIINMKPYDPVAHAWWRFRTEGSVTKWETSRDGVVWDDTWGSTNNLHGFARSDVYFEIIGTTASPGAVHVDNVDLPPP